MKILEKEKAVELWKNSIEIYPTALAFRNLSWWEKENGNYVEAEKYYKSAIQLDNSLEFVSEYLDLLVKLADYKKAFNFYFTIDNELQENENILTNASIAAFNIGEYKFLDKLFSKELCTIQEGDNKVVDLWFLYQGTKLSEEKNIPKEEALKIVRETLEPPKNIDFRMVVI